MAICADRLGFTGRGGGGVLGGPRATRDLWRALSDWSSVVICVVVAGSVVVPGVKEMVLDVGSISRLYWLKRSIDDIFDFACFIILD